MTGTWEQLLARNEGKPGKTVCKNAEDAEHQPPRGSAAALNGTHGGREHRHSQRTCRNASTAQQHQPETGTQAVSTTAELETFNLNASPRRRQSQARPSS